MRCHTRHKAHASEDSHMSNSTSLSYEVDTQYATPRDILPINSLSTWLDERRPPRWPKTFNLSDKISKFLNYNIAEKSEFREGDPNTLTICSQYSLENHESMVSDSDRVHYYRMALFWSGHQEYFNEKTKYYATNKRILEIGTGPMCILAMNARNAGAKHVDALEVNSNASRLASSLVNAYGVSDSINVYNLHSKEYWPKNPEESYDMVVSEIIGDFASQEGICDVYMDIHNRLYGGDIKKIRAVQFIPMKVSTWFVPCTFPDQDNVLYKAMNYSELTIFSPSLKMLQSIDLRIDNLPLCSQWLPLEKLNFNEKLEKQQCQHKISIFRIDKNRGPICGFLVGIDIEIRPGEHFGTRFGHCDSWYTNIVLFKHEYGLKENDHVLVYTIANMKNYVDTNRKFKVTKPSYTFHAYQVRSRIRDSAMGLDIPCNCDSSCVEDAYRSPSRHNFWEHVKDVEVIKELGLVVIDYKEQASAIYPKAEKKVKRRC